jgi:serine/threonine protein phosphatase PrpC
MSSAIRAKAIEHKELVERWSEKEALHAVEVMKPEQMLTQRVIGDVHYSGIVARGIGRELYERTKVVKKDVDRFALIYSMGKVKFKAEVKRRLIPIMKRGYAWESTQSRKLRQQYVKKADNLFGMLDMCELNPEFFKDGAAIEISGVHAKTFESLEFCSAAGMVDKKPRKRKEDISGDAVYFQELYLRGQRGLLFGVFDGLVEGRGDESAPSVLAIKILKEYADRISQTKSTEDIQELLIQYANEADATISEMMKNTGGSTASIGVLVGKQLTYMNIGDSRLYAVSLAGVPLAKKITTDDGICGAIERGASIPVNEFMRESAYPYLYLGSFSQQIRGRYTGKKVFHQGFRLRSPNIGTIDLSNYDLVLGMTDGAWRHLPLKVEDRGMVTDASCELTLGDAARSFNYSSPKDFVESLHSYARLNMNGNSLRKNDYAVLPSPGDMGIIAASI